MDRFVEREIQSLTLHCVNQEQGCEWKGELRNREVNFLTNARHDPACKYPIAKDSGSQSPIFREIVTPLPTASLPYSPQFRLHRSRDDGRSHGKIGHCKQLKKISHFLWTILLVSTGFNSGLVLSKQLYAQ